MVCAKALWQDLYFDLGQSLGKASGRLGDQEVQIFPKWMAVIEGY